MSVRSIDVDKLHVILCFGFDHRAAAADIEALKAAIMGHDRCCHSVEVTGTFDFMAEIILSDVTAYHAFHREFADPIARAASRYEASFVVRRFIPDDDRCDDLWVPCLNGTQRLDTRAIERVTAEGDYVRVHLNGAGWLVHSTMSAMAQRLDSRRFIRVHRSTIVRRDLVQRLVHQDGRWLAVLVDQTTLRVAKSHLRELLDLCRSASSTNGGGRAKLHSVTVS